MHAAKRLLFHEKKTFLNRISAKIYTLEIYPLYGIVIHVQTCSFGIHLQIDLWNPQFLQINLADYALSNRYLPSRSIFFVDTNAIPCVCQMPFLVYVHSSESSFNT